MNEPVIKKAMDTLQYLSQDEEARRIYEGELKAKLEAAKKLLGMGLSLKEITQATGLKEERIAAIRP